MIAERLPRVRPHLFLVYFISCATVASGCLPAGTPKPSVPVQPGTIIEASNEFGVKAKIRVDSIEPDPKGPRWGALQNVINECPEKLAGRTSNELPGIFLREIHTRWPDTRVYSDSYLTPVVQKQASPVPR